MSNARFSILQAKAVKDKNVSDAQFRTLAALGMYADQDGWCYPSLQKLGDDLGKSKQAVGRDTIALRKLGYLEVTARFTKEGARRSSLYRLIFDTPRQREVDTPSTSEVDTPSTSEVDVNDPVNDPKKKKAATPLSAEDMKEIKSSAKKLVNGILENERKAQEREAVGQAWRGRELLPPQYLMYGDWWHNKTQLHMYGSKGKAKVNTEWLKAFKEWWENDVTANTLEQVYESEKSWKGVIGKPSELTTKAVALQALPPEREARKPSVLEQIMLDLQKASINA